MVAVKGPTEDTEAEYMHSLLLSVTILRRTAARFTPPAAGHAGGDPTTPPASLPPLVAQLHQDVRTLNLVKNSQSSESKDVRDLHIKVVNDREAIMRILLDEQETVSEIVPPADRDRIENAVRL